ncbi:MAG: DUF1926 domain-containing protein [Calditrichia bacterium]|nr:DUF1926 domain-containing protein [Calditrichia bacterium]
MKKINFCFGLHNHQPVGNFDFVFESAYEKSYKPLLEMFARFPEFKVTMHYTGPLLIWIEENHPEHFKMLNGMVDRGQVELLSGGFYEPLLSVIPENDARQQILKQNAYLEDKFKYIPKGIWMAERIWEPHLPYIMQDANVDFTILDDTHFKYAGLKPEQLRYHFVTEDEGKSVRVFPIDKNLRYTIPFQKPEVTIEYLQSIASEDKDAVVVFADDGEKFGVWPGTYEQVFEGKWLENFIKLILENLDWINQMHFKEATEQLKPRGPVYLPLASYAEMMEWTLPTESYKEYVGFEHYLKEQKVYERYEIFVRGGFWRNFLTKYPESNNMHKKMGYVSRKIDELLEKHPDCNCELLNKAKDHVWASQCNCGYWHGVFGGLYLNHLRNAIYKNIIQAEVLIEQFQKENNLPIEPFVIFDFNMDGQDELLVETDKFNLYFAPGSGGMMYEMDYKPKEMNFLDTFTRQEEGSHEKLRELAEKRNKPERKKDDDSVASIHDLVVAKEEGLENYLIYDDYEKKSYIDHIFPLNTSLEKMYRNEHEELGDFVKCAYELMEKSQKGENYKVTLQRNGKVKLNGEERTLTVQKKFEINDSQQVIAVEITLINTSDNPLKFKYGTELNYGLLAGRSPDRYYVSNDKELNKCELASKGEINSGKHIAMVDEYSAFEIHLESSQKSNIWYFPVETISLSEAGFERVYQSSNIVYTWDVELKDEWSVKLENKIVDR